MLLQAISFIRPQYAPLHFTAFSLAGSVIRGRLLRQRPLIPTHKAKPRSSAQLLRMLHQPAFISFHYTPLHSSFRSSVHFITFTAPTAANNFGNLVLSYRRYPLLCPARRLLTHKKNYATATGQAAVASPQVPVYLIVSC